MSSLRSDLALCALAVVGVAADLACILTGHTPPQLFDQVVIAGMTGAAGVALQARPSDPAPAAPAAPAPAAPVVQGYTGPVGQ
jgi:hypothetical protein